MSTPGDWLISSDDELFLDSGEGYISREEAIQAGRDEYGAEGFYVARLGDYQYPQPDAQDILERLREQAWDDIADGAENLFDATFEQISELDSLLHKTIQDWARKHDLEHRYNELENLEYIEPLPQPPEKPLVP